MGFGGNEESWMDVWVDRWRSRGGDLMRRLWGRVRRRQGRSRFRHRRHCHGMACRLGHGEKLLAQRVTSPKPDAPWSLRIVLEECLYAGCSIQYLPPGSASLNHASHVTLRGRCRCACRLVLQVRHHTRSHACDPRPSSRKTSRYLPL